MKNMIKNWQVVNKKGTEIYQGVLNREEFLKVFYFFSCVKTDKSIDISKFRIHIAGYCADGADPAYAEGMKTSLVRCIQRTSMLVGDEPIYAIHTNSGSVYYLTWADRCDWQWNALVNVTHNRFNLFSPPASYVAVEDPDDVPKIPDDSDPTGKFDIPKNV